MIIPYTLISCLFNSLPVPPLFTVMNISLQLYPVNTVTRCNNNSYNHTQTPTSTSVKFYLFTRKVEQLKISNSADLSMTNFYFQQPTVIFIHGYVANSFTGSAKKLKDAFVRNGGYNYIGVDARKMFAGPWYRSATDNSLTVGKLTAAFIDHLVRAGVRLESIHLIGHSLGAHAAGVAGKYVRSGKLSRITGLDPAGPLFDKLPPSRRLDKSDALFVDVIHSDMGALGTIHQTGHVDFYPNAGRAPQPGCMSRRHTTKNTADVLSFVLCSHVASVKYFIRSINNREEFPAVKCSSWREFRTNSCDHSEKTFMGLGTGPSVRGSYYLKTNSSQ